MGRVASPKEILLCSIFMPIFQVVDSSIKARAPWGQTASPLETGTGRRHQMVGSQAGRLSKIKTPSASNKAACGHTLKTSGPFWHLPGEPAPEDSLRPFQPPHTWQEISTTGGGDLPEFSLKGKLPPDIHLSPDFWSPWSPWNSGQPLMTNGVRLPGGQAGWEGSGWSSPLLDTDHYANSGHPDHLCEVTVSDVWPLNPVQVPGSPTSTVCQPQAAAGHGASEGPPGGQVMSQVPGASGWSCSEGPCLSLQPCLLACQIKDRMGGLTWRKEMGNWLPGHWVLCVMPRVTCLCTPPHTHVHTRDRPLCVPGQCPLSWS